MSKSKISTRAQCESKLTKIAEAQQKINQTQEKKEIVKPLIIKSYQFEKNFIEKSTNPISITQKSLPQKNVNTPEIFIPDPLPINPNSIANMEKFLITLKKLAE